jgi:hypothetical protein
MKRIKDFFKSIDGTAACYMIAGMLMLIGIAELCTGHYLRAVNSFLYTFIVFITTVTIGQNKRLGRLLVMQHLIICELEKQLKDKTGSDGDNNENNKQEEDEK